MGGLVSAFYAEQLAPAGKVTDIVTLSSPFAGTRLNVFGKGQCNKEMMPRSPLLQHLQMQMKREKTIRYFHVAALLDNTVFPYTSCLTGQPSERELITSSHGHLSLLFSRQITAQVAEWLKQSIPIKQSNKKVKFAHPLHGAKKRPI